MGGGSSPSRFQATDWGNIRKRWRTGPFRRVTASVEEVDGECPYYVAGEREVIVWQDSAVDLRASKHPMCGYAFATMFPLLVAMGFGVDARTIGIDKEDGPAAEGYVNCADPGRGTKKWGGRVIFKLVASPIREISKGGEASQGGW